MSRVHARTPITGPRRTFPRSVARMPQIDVARVKAAVDFHRMAPIRIDVERAKPRVEKAVFGFGFINPVLALPQLYQIFAFKHVAGLSMITIGAALLMSVLWTAYGALGRQTVVWATSAIWVVVNSATLVGVALFQS